jgi:hypothetical protein
VQTFIQDQPDKLDNSGRTINQIGGFLKKYAAAWHVQWKDWLGRDNANDLGQLIRTVICYDSKIKNTVMK